MKWRIRLSVVDYEVLYCLGLILQVPEALSRLPYPSDTLDSKSIDNGISRFASIPAASGEAAEGEGSALYLFFGEFFCNHQCAYKVSQCQPYPC